MRPPAHLSLILALASCGSGSASVKVEASVTTGEKRADAGVTPADAGAVASEPEEPADPTEPAPVEIPNGRLYGGFIIGGLPSIDQIDSALDKDIDSAMSLMSNDEAGVDEVMPHAVRQGFRYLHFTIRGPEDLSEAMAWEFAANIETLEKPAIVHSAHGRRAAAIVALMLHFVEDMPAEEAYAVGVGAGMKDLAPQVRQVLELPPL